MAQVIYSDEAFQDFERIIEFLLVAGVDEAANALNAVRTAIDSLQVHPLLGRRIDAQLRELVISRGATGYLALYVFEPALDMVRILRIRHQREAGYRE